MIANLKKYLVHILAYLILLTVSFVYFSPAAFEGKVLQQSDNIMARGMQAELREYQDPDTGAYPLWTNSMFSGMPGYQILYNTKSPLKYCFTAFLLGNPMWPPHTGVLLLMAGFYFLMVVLKVDWRIALITSIAFGFGSNFMDQVLTGHSTKIVAMGYMGPVLASVILCFRGRYLLGGALTAYFMALQLLANHLQITYYTLILIGILGAVYLYQAIRSSELKSFFLATGIIIAGTGLAFGSNIGRLWTTYEYSQESIRGNSELTVKDATSSGSKAGESGLSKEYVFRWSFGKLETMSLMVPNFMGGTSSSSFVSDPDSDTYRALTRMNDPEKANQLVPATTHYWGTQPSVGSATYFGAAILFLFFLGAFLVKRPIKVWLVIGAALMVMLAWGSNFKLLNYLLFDYFPMYSKFRAVTMAMGPAFFMVCILAALGLQTFISAETSNDEKLKALKLAGAVSGGLLIIAYIISYVSGFNTESLPADVAQAVAADRAALLRADVLRSLLFAGGTFAILWFYLKNNFHTLLAVLGIGALVAVDMFGVARRTLSNDDFVSPGQSQAVIAPSESDKQIMADPALSYRVADFRRGPFADAITSYHHKSIGGYHAAKLMRYQEIIEKYLGNPAGGQSVYDMLNTKYFISPPDRAQQNPGAMGNAWFVPSYEVVADGDAEFLGLASLDPASKALIQQKFAGPLDGYQIQPDSLASISLVSYHPDTLVYRYSAAGPQLAVFSEIYYPAEKGWKTYLDGEPYTDILKANFLLRALPLPAGQSRELKMVFSPKSYYQGEKISKLMGWLILLLGIGALVFFYWKDQGNISDPAQLPDPATQKGAERKSKVSVAPRSKPARKKKPK